jgi:hypothetical protein
MKILSIDIGIINLGYVYVDLDPSDLEMVNVLSCNRTNITNIRHKRVPFCECKLHHEYCIPDYLDHFIQENEDIFTESDIILIERQPPVGITNVQDLIFVKFRSKIFFINPSSVHKHFCMSKEYSKRKEQSESICKKYLENSLNFTNNIRKHDISDAMLMVLYYHKIKNDEFKKNNHPKVLVDFEMFRFNFLQNN